ncbi:hypothetical protein LCGC14_0910320 [marine sediment metagenome]|uniref:Uncharacterized protein n=1 Tax=marine sediment metagenome TaxID=412755 RepID=A0A0F9PEL9_9ZZZZ
MGQYRISRNCEASFIDYLKPLFLSGWGSDRIEKTFAEIAGIELPAICIRLGNTIHNKAEVGSNSTFRLPLILIDIFTRSDGMRLDIKDWVISKIKSGLPYYNYTIVAGEVDTKVQDGRIRVTSIADTGVDLGVDKNTLQIHDKFRHLLSVSISLGRVEI